MVDRNLAALDGSGYVDGGGLPFLHRHFLGGPFTVAVKKKWDGQRTCCIVLFRSRFVPTAKAAATDWGGGLMRERAGLCWEGRRWPLSDFQLNENRKRGDQSVGEREVWLFR